MMLLDIVILAELNMCVPQKINDHISGYTKATTGSTLLNTQVYYNKKLNIGSNYFISDGVENRIIFTKDDILGFKNIRYSIVIKEKNVDYDRIFKGQDSCYAEYLRDAGKETSIWVAKDNLSAELHWKTKNSMSYIMVGKGPADIYHVSCGSYLISYFKEIGDDPRTKRSNKF